jgi:hypothetical protein
MVLVKDAFDSGEFEKLTLGKPAHKEGSPVNIYIRPVVLSAGRRLQFVSRFPTRDLTKNYAAPEAAREVEKSLGTEFMDAHLHTHDHAAQLEMKGGEFSLRIKKRAKHPAPQPRQTNAVNHIDPKSGWLRALGVTGHNGVPLAGMADKFRQISKYRELLAHRIGECHFGDDRRLHVYDMGSGKGYLTFAASALLGDRAEVVGVEARPELAAACTQIADAEGFGGRLSFRCGTIADTAVAEADILIALHACDTATDDAIAKGIEAGAKLVIVSPCCQKELRPRIVPPDALAPALRHGIFLERQAEFLTDSLRAGLLEWAGYSTRVMEFISTEHTARNIMISAVKTGPRGNEQASGRVRSLASLFGIKHQSLADHLGFIL